MSSASAAKPGSNDAAAKKKQVAGYSWEDEYKRSWDELQEDDDGLISTAVAQLAFQLKRRRLQRQSVPQLRGVVRHMMLVLDLSETMYTEKDFKPSRLALTMSLMSLFVQEFFDQNPLSQLGVIATCNGIAYLVSDISANPSDQRAAILRIPRTLDATAETPTQSTGNLEGSAESLHRAHNGFGDDRESSFGASSSFGADQKQGDFETAASFDTWTSMHSIVPGGEPSLQNALVMAASRLAHTPRHGTREILVLYSALMSCDPGNLPGTISLLQDHAVRVTMLSYSAEIFVCRKICEETGGLYAVAINETHMRDLVVDCIPPPTLSTESAKKSNAKLQHLIQMGFPIRRNEKMQVLCACHHKHVRSAFQCPRCKTFNCMLPCDCATCGLTLVLSPHLARSYHHLIGLPYYTEFGETGEGEKHAPSLEVDHKTHCAGCNMRFAGPPAYNKKDGKKEHIGHEAQPRAQALLSSSHSHSESAASAHARVNADAGLLARHVCPQCNEHYCLECNLFIHEDLHSCPTCTPKKDPN